MHMVFDCGEKPSLNDHTRRNLVYALTTSTYNSRCSLFFTAVHKLKCLLQCVKLVYTVCISLALWSSGGRVKLVLDYYSTVHHSLYQKPHP